MIVQSDSVIFLGSTMGYGTSTMGSTDPMEIFPHFLHKRQIGSDAQKKKKHNRSHFILGVFNPYGTNY